MTPERPDPVIRHEPIGSGDTPRRHRREALPTRSPASGWAITAVLAVIAVVVYVIRYALMPFVFAVAIAFVVEPLVLWLQTRLGRRWRAALVVYLAVLAVVAAAVYWVGRNTGSELFEFLRKAPEIARNLLQQLLGPQVELFGQTYTPEQLVDQLGAALPAALGVGAAARAVEAGIGALFGGFLMLVLTGYLLFSGPMLAAGAIWLIPPERRHSIEELLPRIIPALRRYLVGIVVVVAYTAAVAWIGFGPVFHLPRAALLAVTVGFLELIPVVGPFASGALVALTAVQQHGLAAILSLVGFAIALRLTIDNLVGPLVLGKAGRVHPVVVIFAFVAGAMLFGVIGLLLAVPTAVCIRIVLQHYYAEPVKPEPGP